MKKLILISLLALSNIAIAQQTPLQRVKMDIYCGDGAAMKRIIDKFEEKAFINFISERLMVNGQIEQFEGRLFVNEKTHSFTLIEKIVDDLYCVIGSGNSIKPHKEDTTGPGV